MYPRVRGENLSLLHPTRNALEIIFLRFLDNHQTIASWMSALRR